MDVVLLIHVLSGVFFLALVGLLGWVAITNKRLAATVKRLNEQIPGTGMTAKELATELGPAINEAFAQYVPQPEKLGSVLGEAVATAANSVTEPIQSVGKSLQETTATLTQNLETTTDKWQAAFSGHAAELQQTLQSGQAQWQEKLVAALTDHAGQVEAANTQLAAKLEHIATLAKEIEKLLHVQESVEQTVQSVVATEEFKRALEALRTHLESSDQLLREAAKPRTIRLVESDGEVSEAVAPVS